MHSHLGFLQFKKGIILLTLMSMGIHMNYNSKRMDCSLVLLKIMLALICMGIHMHLKPLFWVSIQ
jgi:hypothetical protein